VSRLPWLTALAAWGTDGTWTRGLAFVARGTAAAPPGPPHVGDLAPLLRRWDLDLRRPATFAVERTRGWTETPDSPPPNPDDHWDERRVSRLTMMKPRPGTPATHLIVRGWYAAFRGSDPGRGPARYAVTFDQGPEQPLAGVQWADWSRDGRLLVATTAGELQVRDDPRSPQPSWRRDLAAMAPAPEPPPPEAQRW
jgi:hypothetical protein